MNHYAIFFLGMFIGQFMMLFAVAVFNAAKEADEQAEKALAADDLYGRTCDYLLTNKNL